MSRVQIILTPAGERLAIMPAEDYESLVTKAGNADDDRADLARIDEILAETKRGDALPLEGMKRILAGESPVRVWREFRGLSQAKLATKAGIVASHVNMIENRKRAGTVAKLKRIASALGVDLDDLVT
jgi:antitoxin component HigA of HigAB toxin-antitoxin module